MHERFYGVGEPLVQRQREQGIDAPAYLELVKGLGCNAFRSWMHLTELLNDPVTPNMEEVKKHTALLDRAAVLDIEVTAMSHEWFLPEGCKQRMGHAVPKRDLTPGSLYMQTMEMLETSFHTMVSLFPQVRIWEVGNEWNLNAFLHPDGFLDTDMSAPFTADEKMDIAVDMMYFAARGVRRANPKALVASFSPALSTPGLGGDMPDYLPVMYGVAWTLDKVYRRIKSGNFWSTDTDDYFDLVAWHPYVFTNRDCSDADLFLDVDEPDQLWQLFGHTSFYTIAGYGTEMNPEEYEPFAFRTFRYVQLKIETAAEPLRVLRFVYRATGYPLDVKTKFTASDPSFAPIWDISVRTLRRCMHETYMDCPFYEQLQYAMDGRSEILYTYALSADDRLARQAMDAFRRSQRPDGLVNCDAPTVSSNVIPGFSIYYLLMVYDHMMYFGDPALVKMHLPAIDAILGFFDRNLNALGLVGKVGGKLFRARCWSFIEWTERWDTGVPGASDRGCGSITMESLLYLYGLQHAAELAAFAGRTGLAEEYRRRADVIKAAVRKHCVGSYKDQPMIQDGPDVDEYSVHSQVFAVLTGVVSPEEGLRMLKTAVGDPELAQASVAFAFYLFRALEKCGWYEKTDELWELWRQMLRDNMTTCVENDTDARSDCHAWASLLCYEMPAVILGVRPAAPGFAKVKLNPQMGVLSEAEGDVITPKGVVHVAWKKRKDGSCRLDYRLPAGMEMAEQVK